MSSTDRRAAQRFSPFELREIAVLIPAWQPDHRLLTLLVDLVSLAFGDIVVVNDGSSEESAGVFTAARRMPSVTVLSHAVNLGKGRALKTGIHHVLLELSGISSVITADADGQHTAADILRVAHASQANPERVVLGVRDFARDVPLRSRFGNWLTRKLFLLMTAAKVSDTQTGLRALPRSILPVCVVLSGERYEYEMTVLAYLCRHGYDLLEVPIATIYIDGNRTSHFDPVRDSMRIYFVLLRFYLSSLMAAGFDFAGFSIAFVATHHLLLSILVGRLSSIVNFTINKGFVFRSRRPVQGTLGRYYTLALFIAAASYGLVWFTMQYLRWNVFAAKVTIDVLLSIFSFSVQQKFVFRREREFSV
jgi:glycosyltransferase involved in cell wall biosynthesis